MVKLSAEEYINTQPEPVKPSLQELNLEEIM